MMNYMKVYLFLSGLTVAAWGTMIATIKLIEYIISIIPVSPLRSMVGLGLYGLWGIALIASIKAMLKRLSANLTHSGNTAPKKS